MSGSMGNKIRHNSKAFTTCEQNRAVVKALLFFVLSKYDQPDKDKRLNMRKTNNNNISKVIEEYISSSPIRPVLIWFHSNQDIDNARRAISEMNGCATCGQALYIDKAGQSKRSLRLEMMNSSSFLEHTTRALSSSCSTAMRNN